MVAWKDKVDTLIGKPLREKQTVHLSSILGQVMHHWFHMAWDLVVYTHPEGPEGTSPAHVQTHFL